jgi:hypothetical protein
VRSREEVRQPSEQQGVRHHAAFAHRRDICGAALVSFEQFGSTCDRIVAATQTTLYRVGSITGSTTGN